MKITTTVKITFILFTTFLIAACDGSRGAGENGVGGESQSSALSVLDTSTSEGNFLQFEFRLEEPHPQAINVSYQFIGGTAIAGQHYTRSTNVITIPKNTTSAYLDIETVDDANNNPDRTVLLAVNKAITASNETIETSNVTATGTIIDNDIRIAAAVCLQDKVCPVDFLNSIGPNQSQDIDCLLDLDNQTVQLPDNVKLVHKNGGHIINGAIEFGANGSISGFDAWFVN